MEDGQTGKVGVRVMWAVDGEVSSATVSVTILHLPVKEASVKENIKNTENVMPDVVQVYICFNPNWN